MDYTSLITSEHQKTKFQALVSLLTGSIDANTQLINSMPALFDLDAAIGQQLDYVGQWIGFSRYISPSVSNVFFSLDTSGLGLDQGVWQDVNSSAGLTVLPDDAYRNLLYARIALNQWDGSISAAINILQLAFPNNAILIQDNQDMTMNVGVTGTLDALTQALLTRGYFNARPCGVQVTTYYTNSVANAPFFGLDVENSLISGLDVGAWAIPLQPS